MKYDIVERADRAHREDGFCEIISCPECELRRSERLAPGKELRLLKHELEATVESQRELIEFLYGTIDGLQRDLENVKSSREFWMEQSERNLVHVQQQ